MESWFLAGSHAQDYEAGIDPTTPYQGKNSGYIKSIVEELKGFGTLMQMFKAAVYRNKRMRFAAVVKSARVEIWTGLWMRVDSPEDGKALGFDNMLNRPIRGTTDWQKCEVVLDVPQESVYVAFGILLSGRGQAWLSDVRFEEVGTEVPVTAPRGEYPGERVSTLRALPAKSNESRSDCERSRSSCLWSSALPTRFSSAPVPIKTMSASGAQVAKKLSTSLCSAACWNCSSAAMTAASVCVSAFIVCSFFRRDLQRHRAAFVG